MLSRARTLDLKSKKNPGHMWDFQKSKDNVEETN